MDWYYITYGLVLRYVWIGITLRNWYYVTYGLVLRSVTEDTSSLNCLHYVVYRLHYAM